MVFDNEIKKEVYSWIKTIILAIVLALIFRTYIFRTAYAMSISMEPTLHEGQILIISKISYLVHEPQRGDIVVIDSRQDKLEHLNLIKRIVGMPGETVEIKDNKVYIDGKPLDPDYTMAPTPDFGFVKTTIPEGKYMVMGDNREHSRDSRFDNVGFIDRDYLQGKAVFRIWPFSNVGKLK
ncbi:MAG TPA: signal peptidase I [Negativicutes bacterium]|nr:signal peptidase I [Negativicutes bacterium]